MRRLYIIRENEEDGRLLDALIAAGRSTREDEFENPACPLCGHGTLLGYTEGDAFNVITWPVLDENDVKDADEWFLLCNRLDCTYVEQVERVANPMGADPFDVGMAHMEFDEYCGLTSRNPVGLTRLITWLRSALAAGGPNRKLQDLLDQAEWHEEYRIAQVRKWIDRVPPGKRVEFRTDTFQTLGTFVTATEDGFMVLSEPGGELLSVRADAVWEYRPWRPHKEDLPKPTEELLKELVGDDQDIHHRLIAIHGDLERVVIRGFHLILHHVDKFGQYHVGCGERPAAEALGLKAVSEEYWEGVYRRSEIDGRYDTREMVKVRGHWLDVTGYANHGRWPAVRTYDPAVGAALGLELDKPWRPIGDDDDDEPKRTPLPPSWSGIVPEQDVEENKVIRLYLWPLPEFGHK